ncbi:DUF2894 domain-containing protein [Bordetella genomosp. 1]|uniref:DUF2894 domain-containing protein n=1 Tax=Bordetella genomosp. 1 TaxID=1395607 RepID=UPI0015C69455|nr:DUF2894 domain-containing protein [Bordetella genomosp. 1]
MTEPREQDAAATSAPDATPRRGDALRRLVADSLARRAERFDGPARERLLARSAALAEPEGWAAPRRFRRPTDAEAQVELPLEAAAATEAQPDAPAQENLADASAVVSVDAAATAETGGATEGAADDCARNPDDDAPAARDPHALDTDATAGADPLTQTLAALLAGFDDAVRQGDAAAHHPGRHYPELPLLDELRDLWSHLSADQQVRHSEALVPDNAGPLNSSHLVHRSLALMRELSPEYLRRFLLYAEGLSWMEQLDAALSAAREAPAKKAGTRAKGTRRARAG